MTLCKYLVFDSDTDELLDVIELMSSEKQNFEKNNPDVYLKENEDYEDDFFNEWEDDFEDDDEWIE